MRANSSKRPPRTPFLTEGGLWVLAADLQPGMAVLSATGTSGAVEALIPTDRAQPMHNLEVDAAHTYFVGAGQWVVHNGCSDQELLEAAQDWGVEYKQSGNYHTYDWELVSVDGPHAIFPDNPDPHTGLGGERYYIVVRGTDHRGNDRNIHISLNWIPELNRFGNIKLSSTDPGPD
ncbi:hypothetical protein HC928_11210 [bacterium]|nr:hypothetical protein [bacterium]